VKSRRRQIVNPDIGLAVRMRHSHRALRSILSRGNDPPLPTSTALQNRETGLRQSRSGHRPTEAATHDDGLEITESGK
jgi:hypothetical protein